MKDLQTYLAGVDLNRAMRGLVLALGAAALVWNLAVCWKVYRAEPLREAASRSLMAVNSSFFYASGLSEPVPVAVLKLSMLTGADPDVLVRAGGLAAFAAVFGTTIFVLGSALGGVASAMAALFLAANPYMGYYAMQGASHLYALFFLLLFWHYFDSPAGGRRHALLAGLYGGLACLSRLDAAWVLLIVAALAWAVRRRAFPLKEAALSLGLALLLALPYAVYQKVQYGGFFYAQELSLRRWANIDAFGYEPGPVRPQAPLGAGAFLLRNGPAGAMQDFFSGLGRSLAYELPRTLYYKFLLVLVFLGVYGAFVVKKPRLLALLAAALLPVLPLAAIKQVPATGGIELKYYLWALWALCALAGLGFQELLAWFEARLNDWARAKSEAIERMQKSKERQAK